jgi:hypothetical protein
MKNGVFWDVTPYGSVTSQKTPFYNLRYYEDWYTYMSGFFVHAGLSLCKI